MPKTKVTAKPTGTKGKKAAKRELINSGPDKRYVRGSTSNTFTEDQGPDRSPPRGRQKAKSIRQSGRGAKGERKSER